MLFRSTRRTHEGFRVQVGRSHVERQTLVVAVIVDEGWKSGSISAELAARIAETALYELDAPVRRICARELPVPYAEHLEAASLPQVADIVDAVRALVYPAGQG